jgi:small subunit ribosomal protein S23
MGIKQIRPARLYKAAENELSNRILQNKAIPTPPWFEVVNSVPPSENAVRTVALRHRAAGKKATKPRNLYRPQQITYPEDSLRSTFYKDHPWELARPRNIVETDGRDAQRYDWSRGLRQRGMQLTGER